MSQLKFSVKLFDTTSVAADGSTIPRRSCEAYLSSDDYTRVINDRLGIGGESHKDRKLKQDLRGLVGMDDQVLINNNALHYYTKLYFKPGDNFLYADAITFDPDLFAGERKDKIVNEIGMLSSGVKLPVSVVIQALWSKRNVAEKIVRIKGFDFTLNPSFKGAGDVEVYSPENVEDSSFSDDQIKQFSEGIEGDFEIQTKIFSCTGEVTVLEDINTLNYDKVFSDGNSSVDYFDIVRVYGIHSPQAKIISNKEGKRIEKEEIKNALDDKILGINGSTSNSEFIFEKVKDIMDDENGPLISSMNKGGRMPAHFLENSICESDVDRDKSLNGAINSYIGYKIDDNSYSTVSSITDRLVISEQPRFTRMSRLINGYKSMASSREFSSNQLLRMKLLFIQDLNLLIKEVLPEIKKGRAFNSLYALSRFGDDIKSTSDTLSDTYRKMLISESVMKFVPKTLYGVWLSDIQDFYRSMLEYVFGESLKEFQMNLIDYKIEK